MLTFDLLCRGLDVNISATCEIRQDAAFVLSEDEDTAVHYVLSGEGVAWRATGEATELSPHTVMIVPPGSRLTITSDAGRPLNLAEPKCEPLAPGGWNLLTVGDAPQGITLACGYVHARYVQVTELFDYLREPLIQNAAEDRSFREPFHHLLEELAEPKPGTKVLAEMLMKQCLIALLRSQSETSGECFVPWLAAIGDQSLGRALAAMLDAPQANHTLESLGDVAGISRGAFAERFRETFGRTGDPAPSRRASTHGDKPAGQDDCVSGRLRQPQLFLPRIQGLCRHRSRRISCQPNRAHAKSRARRQRLSWVRLGDHCE